MSAINIEAPDNVRSFRHKAVSILKAARRPFERAEYGTASREAYSLLNGTIETILRGRTGLSQDEQVAYLKDARSKAEENLNLLGEVVERAKEEIAEKFSDEAREAALARAKERYTEKVAQINARFDAGSPEGLDGTVKAARPVLALLDEAAEFAATRDFDAWQEQKRARFYGESEPVEAEESDPEDGDED